MRGSLRVWALFLLVALLSSDAPPAQPAAPLASSVAHLPIRSASPAPPLQIVPLPVETPPEVTTPPTALASPVSTPKPPIATLYRITIPRLGISLLIREGDVVRDIDNQHTPENYAFHLPGTLMPGEGGNTYLYAHARAGMFLSLWNARVGDDVFVTAPDGRVLAYVIRGLLPRVEPTDVSSTVPTATERLTLQTSTGPSPSDPRFVVFAFPRGG